MEFYQLEVDSIIKENHNTKSFLLKPKPEHEVFFDYKSGQFLSFRIPVGNVFVQRCYSLSSHNNGEFELKITVKKVPDGNISKWFNDKIKLGDIVDVKKPSGRFVLRASSKPVLFFAGGSGITPIISLIKHVIQTTDRKIYLLYANRDRYSIIFYAEIQKLVAKYQHRFYCQYHLSKDSGRIDESTINTFINQANDGHIYICGPESFMDMVETIAEKNNFNNNNIFIERFTTLKDQSIDHKKTISSIAIPKNIYQFRAILDGEIHEVPYIYNETLLDCLLSVKLEPTYSCKNAHCGSCMVTIKSGNVVMKKTTILSKRDLSRGYILLCQAFPQSKNVMVDCDE